MKKILYVLTPGDKEIIKASRKNPNIFSNFYLKSDTSGTWWLPGSRIPQRGQNYGALYREWLRLKKPESFSHSGKPYTAVMEHEMSELHPGLPAFHHNHGVMYLKFGEELFHDRTPIRTIIGGFGAGKSLQMTLVLLDMAATISEFRAFVLGPYSNQAAEIFRLALSLMAGTEYEKRFFVHSVERPYPKLFIGSAETGVNTIEFYPLNDESALRNLTGDLAVIEQAEHPSIDLTEAIRSVGTRLRGRTIKHGRARVGTITLIANADDNAQLWEIYDKAEEDPKMYRAWSPSTYDNPYLTDKDYERFEEQVGGSEELKKQYMLGKRPRGNGKHFSRATLDLLEDDRLDKLMQYGLREQDENNRALGYIYSEGKGAGVVEWLLPAQDDREYVVISDPGTENPPHRDSPPIMVWDITKFSKQPATLAGFVWVYGHRNIQNWATRYREMVARYRAYGRNGFDATGYQSGYDQWLVALELLLPEKINLAGNGKALCLNSAKMLSTAGLMKLPKAISAIYDHLSRYEYPPEPKHLRQDVAICFMMSAWYMQRFFYVMEGEFNERPGYDPNDRYFRPEKDRYGDHIR